MSLLTFLGAKMKKPATKGKLTETDVRVMALSIGESYRKPSRGLKIFSQDWRPRVNY